jgi:hypothetical protein
MKIAILLLALIFGYTTPIYSQLNRHRKTDATTEQYQNKMNADFSNYKFVDKFSGSLSDRWRDSFNMSPMRPAPSAEIYSGDNMPCVHPKSGDEMPCLKPNGMFHMRVFKPKNGIWGILW